jgi:hypothetical protein
MQTVQTIETELKKGFTAKQATILSKVIFKAHSELVKADDFNELKDIVKELAEADVFKKLEDKVKAVKEEYKGIEPLRILITHYATKAFLKKAEEKGVIVAQSFEW